MSEMGIERMRQAHLAIRKLMEVAVRKRRRLKIREQPVFDIRADRLDRVESQRCSAVDVSMKHADPGIEPTGEQGDRHFGFEDGVEIVEQSISGRRCPGGLAAQERGSGPECEPRITPARTPSTVRSKPLRIAASEPYGHPLPKAPIDPRGLGFD